MVVYWNRVPEEISGAAMIDSAREVSIFLRIGSPTILPGPTTLLLISFVAICNNYFLPLVMLSDSNRYPLILGITTIYSLKGFPVENLMLMGAFLTALPLLILFLVLQRILGPISREPSSMEGRPASGSRAKLSCRAPYCSSNRYSDTE